MDGLQDDQHDPMTSEQEQGGVRQLSGAGHLLKQMEDERGRLEEEIRLLRERLRKATALQVSDGR